MVFLFINKDIYLFIYLIISIYKKNYFPLNIFNYKNVLKPPYKNILFKKIFNS